MLTLSLLLCRGLGDGRQPPLLELDDLTGILTVRTSGYYGRGGKLLLLRLPEFATDCESDRGTVVKTRTIKVGTLVACVALVAFAGTALLLRKRLTAKTLVDRDNTCSGEGDVRNTLFS